VVVSLGATGWWDMRHLKSICCLMAELEMLLEYLYLVTRRLWPFLLVATLWLLLWLDPQGFFAPDGAMPRPAGLGDIRVDPAIAVVYDRHLSKDEIMAAYAGHTVSGWVENRRGQRGSYLTALVIVDGRLESRWSFEGS